MTANDKIPISSCLLMTFHEASAAPLRPAHSGTWRELHRESDTARGPNAVEGYIREQTVQASDSELSFIGEKTFHFFNG